MELKEEKRRAKEVAKQNSELRGENRKLRARLKELELSNSKLREKNKELKKLTFVKQRIGNITQVGNTETSAQV
jgi:regulator of replication initiation timing